MPSSAAAAQTTRPGGESSESGRAAGAGPLLAIVALCGGAGASTLAYLIARSSARSDAEPVLVCDAGGLTAGLASYAGVESPRSLTGAADAVAAGEELADGLFVSAAPGLRMIARGPDLESEGDGDAITRLLADARTAHRLTIADCGTLGRAAELRVRAAATHVAWVLPATLSGLRRARRVLDLFPDRRGCEELLIARRDASGRRAPTPELGELAGERGVRLVLMPHVADLAEHRPESAIEEAGVALEAIRAALRR